MHTAIANISIMTRPPTRHARLPVELVVMPDDRTARMQERFEVPVIVAALLVIPAMALARSEPGSKLLLLGEIPNVVIWLAFAAELAAILYVTPRRWRWMREHPLEPMIVLLTPPIMPASLQAARVLRLLRLSRLVRLAQVARSLGGGATCSVSSPGTPELCRAAAPMRSSKPRP